MADPWIEEDVHPSEWVEEDVPFQPQGFQLGPTPPGQELTTVDKMGLGVEDFARGVLKGVPQIITRPADLLVRGARAGMEALGAPEVDETPYLPTNIWNKAVDIITPDEKYYPKIEKAGEVAGSIPGFLGGPSAVPGALKATAELPMLARAGIVGASSAPEGAALGVLANSNNPQKPILEAAKEGAIANAVTAGAMPIASEVASDIGTGLKNVSNRLFETSLGGAVKDFVKSEKLKGAVLDDDSKVLETTLSKSYQNVNEQGVVPTFATLPTKITAVRDARQLVGQDIGDIVSSVDQAGITPTVTLAKAQKVVDEAPFTVKDDLQAQLNAFKGTLSAWDGTAVGLHKAKSSVGEIAYSTPARGNAPAQISNKMQRAIEEDLRDSLHGAMKTGIESGRISEDTLTQFLDANQKYGALKDVERIGAPAALSAQHQRVGKFQRAMWTTGGFGSSAGLAAAYGLPLVGGGLAAAGTVAGLGATMRTSVAQGIESVLAKGGAGAMQLLSEITNNPYFVRGVSLVPLPRNWSEVKNNNAARQTIALKAGMDPMQFNSLPETAQKAIHTQVILTDPNSAEPIPGNLSIVNGEFQNPLEKDEIMKDAADKDPATRAKIISAAWQNKYVGDSPAITPKPQATTGLPNLSEINDALTLPPSEFSMGETFGDSPLAQLQKMTAIHAEDIQ